VPIVPESLPLRTRAYLSAGLPGAEWWVADRGVDRAQDADIDLDEVERLYSEHDMWDPSSSCEQPNPLSFEDATRTPNSITRNCSVTHVSGHPAPRVIPPT
jgi:hypothetical protein